MVTSSCRTARLAQLFCGSGATGNPGRLSNRPTSLGAVALAKQGMIQQQWELARQTQGRLLGEVFPRMSDQVTQPSARRAI